jgi:hypothetical protein
MDRDGKSASSNGKNQEVVAEFHWRSLLTSPKHPFDLTVMGSGISKTMRGQWTLMALMTVLRLWALHLYGKTSQGPVAVAEKIEGKGKSVS